MFRGGVRGNTSVRACNTAVPEPPKHWSTLMNLLKTILAASLVFISATAFAALDVNKASQAELEAIKGIGPAMSAKILDARKSGAFKDWADMQARVKGVRDGNAAKFSTDGLTVNGASFAGAPTRPATAAVVPVRPAAAAKK